MMTAPIMSPECPKCGAQMELINLVYKCPDCNYRISKDDYEDGRWRLV